MLFLLAACSEKQPVELPREKSGLVLRSLAYAEAENYASALDNVRKLKIIDPTNEFLYEFERIMLDSMYVAKSQKLLDSGDVQGALDVLNAALKTHGARLKNSLAAQGKLLQVLKVQSLVESLSYAQSSQEMERAARSLETLSAAVPDYAFLKPFAERKKADSEKMRRVEEGKTPFLIWCMAVDAAREKRYIEYDTLGALLEACGASEASEMVFDAMDYQNRGGEKPLDVKQNNNRKGKEK